MTSAKTIEMPGKEPVDDSQALARQVLIALNGAFKKIRLYPPEHVIYQTALNVLKHGLDDFIDRHGNLVLTIDRHKIYYKDEIVHEGATNEENFAFILFRDGIYHLEFQKSIELWEIHSFLEIMQKNQILTEDAENDVVTALWELELPSLHYKAEDVGFDTGKDFEIPELGEFETSEEYPDVMAADADDTEPIPDLQIPMHDKELWEITAQDREHLRNMLAEEEDRESIEYVLYILLYLLQQQMQPDDFSEIMDFLAQELKEAMMDHKYQSVYNTLQKLKNNLDPQKALGSWSIPLLEDFFASLSGEAFLKIMHNDWDGIAGCPPEELAYLKQALLLLNAEAIASLGPMLLETPSNQTKEMLMLVIGILSEREFEHLGKLLSSPDTNLVKMLVHVMGGMENKPSFKKLLELQRHASADVRQEALKAIFRRKSNMLGELGSLMNDPDEKVQRLFLRYAAEQRDVKTERLLLSYLKKHRIRSGNKRFISLVYIALGKCGSDESLPFLEKDLFFLPGLGILRSKKSLRRQAAVSALKELNTEKAKTMLNRKSKGLYANQT